MLSSREGPFGVGRCLVISHWCQQVKGFGGREDQRFIRGAMDLPLVWPRAISPGDTGENFTPRSNREGDPVQIKGQISPPE